MRALVRPGGRVRGETTVPGDKSIAHRWLILAATALGGSELRDLPPSLDVRSTARCLAALAPGARDELETWAGAPPQGGDGHGFTSNGSHPRAASTPIAVRAGGRARLEAPAGELDCGNSGTTMRLLAGMLASAPFATVLTGDASLLRRPMERVATPLRRMGATVRTVAGGPPLEIVGGELRGIEHRTEVPSAQVKGAVLLAGLAAEGQTTVIEPAPTRDHTERALVALGAPITVREASMTVERFAHEGFSATVPGDVSSAAFLVAAAALTAGELTVPGVGLNPSRTRFLEVLRRMGVRTETRIAGEELGEPVGELHVVGGAGIRGVLVEPDELPLVVDEVPVLAALAAYADGETRLTGAGELRVKESDRLAGTAAAIRGLGGEAAIEGDDLVIAGGGLGGGTASSRGDHRMAMALAVAGLAARGPCTIDGIEAADVSFPGFVPALAGLGAALEVEGSP